MLPPEIHVFSLQQIALGPDEIRGQVGSFAFIYTKYSDPDGNRWFVQPGYVGHERMTNTRGMLRAFFGPRAGEIAGQVVAPGEMYSKDGQGQYVSTGQEREIWDWRTIRLLAKRENLFGRAGTLCGRRVVMLWGDPPGWEAMLVVVLEHLGIGRESEAVVVLGNLAQFDARLFLPPVETGAGSSAR
jgi:hypothetical protein